METLQEHCFGQGLPGTGWHACRLWVRSCPPPSSSTSDTHMTPSWHTCNPWPSGRHLSSRRSTSEACEDTLKVFVCITWSVCPPLMVSCWNNLWKTQGNTRRLKPGVRGERAIVRDWEREIERKREQWNMGNVQVNLFSIWICVSKGQHPASQSRLSISGPAGFTQPQISAWWGQYPFGPWSSWPAINRNAFAYVAYLPTSLQISPQCFSPGYRWHIDGSP